MTSSRLPGKIMMKIKNIPVIQILYERLKKSKLICKTIVATTNNQTDDNFVEFLKKKKISFYRGSEFNVIKRVIEAAKKFKAKNVVLITGDCPLIDPDIVDQCIRTFKFNKADFVNNSNIRTFSDGLDVQVFKLSALIKSYKLIKIDNNKEKEHVTLSLRKNKKYFKTINILSGPRLNYPDIFVTLDEIEDFKLIKKVIYYFWNKKRKYFSAHELINFIRKKHLFKINQNIARKGNN